MVRVSGGKGRVRRSNRGSPKQAEGGCCCVHDLVLLRTCWVCHNPEQLKRVHVGSPLIVPAHASGSSMCFIKKRCCQALRRRQGAERAEVLYHDDAG